MGGGVPLPSPDGAPCAKAAEATATTVFRCARPQLSEPRVIQADERGAHHGGLLELLEPWRTGDTEL